MQLGEREYHLPGCMRLLETNNSTLNLSDANNSAISKETINTFIHKLEYMAVIK